MLDASTFIHNIQRVVFSLKIYIHRITSTTLDDINTNKHTHVYNDLRKYPHRRKEKHIDVEAAATKVQHINGWVVCQRA